MAKRSTAFVIKRKPEQSKHSPKKGETGHPAQNVNIVYHCQKKTLLFLFVENKYF
jgi:hypothetical protein